jgi:hypothetical protein
VKELDVSLTDYGLTAECAYFTYVFATFHAGHPLAAVEWMWFFASIGLAAATGGTVHAFYAEKRSTGYRLLWPLTLILIGVTACSGTWIAARLLFSGEAFNRITAAAVAVLLLYTAVVLFVRQDYMIAVLNYLPALSLLGVALLIEGWRAGAHVPLGAMGVALMFFAAAAHRAKLKFHSRYFDHNAVYHVLQAMALWMIFVAGRHAIQLTEAIQ